MTEPFAPKGADEGVTLRGGVRPGDERVLSRGALGFVAKLCRQFAPRLNDLLDARSARRLALDAGGALDFLPETARIRESNWRVDPLPPDLTRRIVEITGPVDRKMIINALNSPADVFMADFEDATSPTWHNVVDGQLNLMDACLREITHHDPVKDKHYELGPDPATLMVRPRGWHLSEKHVEVDGAPVPAALFDFGLHFFHNAEQLLRLGSGPYFYLPKLESHLEARLWNDVFVAAQNEIGIPIGTVKATVLIETLPAAFEMNEILYELRRHSAGLNCGRWDYIFSYIKTHRSDPGRIVPDRSVVTMEQPFMRAYTQLVVKTCHERGVHAMGGMAAQIPLAHDEAANRDALEKVAEDKAREARDGHDGTWVAHPGLVGIAREAFASVLSGPNQLERRRDDVRVTAEDLLRHPEGRCTEGGLRHDVKVGVRYLESWLAGRGCVPLYGLMEDAATAEISRAQVWQWLHHGARLDDGMVVDLPLFERVLDEEMESIRDEVGDEEFENGLYDAARHMFAELCRADELTEFLTLPGYERLIEEDGRATEPVTNREEPNVDQP